MLPFAFYSALLCAILPSVRADVIKFPGQVVQALNNFWGSPGDGEVLSWNATTSTWEPASLGSVVVSITEITTMTQGQLLHGQSGSLTNLTVGTEGYPLCSNGDGADLSYRAPVAAALPGAAAQIGAVTSSAAGSLPVLGSTAATLIGPSTTTGTPLVSAGAGVAPAYGDIVATALPAGVVEDLAAITSRTSGSLITLHSGAVSTLPLGNPGYYLHSAGGESPEWSAVLASDLPGLTASVAACTSTQAAGSVMVANSGSVVPLAPGTATHVLTSNGTGEAPSWQAAGGLAAPAAQGNILVGDATPAWAELSPGTAKYALVSQGAGSALAYASVLWANGSVSLTSDWDVNNNNFAHVAGIYAPSAAPMSIGGNGGGPLLSFLPSSDLVVKDSSGFVAAIVSTTGVEVTRDLVVRGGIDGSTLHSAGTLDIYTDDASGATAAVSIKTGDSSGADSGLITIDVGAFATSPGTISVGASYAGDITIGNESAEVAISGSSIELSVASVSSALSTSGNLSYASATVTVTGALDSDQSLNDLHSGTVVWNSGAATRTVTLPDCAAGLLLYVRQGVDAQEFRLIPRTGETIEFSGGTVTDAENFYSSAARSSVILIGVDATTWAVFGEQGTWNEQSN